MDKQGFAEFLQKRKIAPEQAADFIKLGDQVGAEKRNHIFAGVELPPLGTSNERKPPITATVIERMQASLGDQTCQAILSGCLRDLSDEWFQAPRQKYLELGDLDAFLAWKGDDFIAQLEGIKDEGGLFFSQAINEDVIGFVESVPKIRQGTREGNTLYEIKTAGWILDLGPEDGNYGGYILAEGTPEQVAQLAGSYTGRYLSQCLKN